MEMCSPKQIWEIWDHPALCDLLREAVPRWLWAGLSHRPGSRSQHRLPGPPGQTSRTPAPGTPEDFGSGPAAAPAQLLGLRIFWPLWGGKGSS